MATVKRGPCMLGARAQHRRCAAWLLAAGVLGPIAWAQPPSADDADASRGDAAHAPIICERLRAAATERCRPVARLGDDGRAMDAGSVARGPERTEPRER